MVIGPPLEIDLEHGSLAAEDMKLVVQQVLARRANIPFNQYQRANPAVPGFTMKLAIVDT
ncbi:hypothetical protein D3C71_2173920 [compost metagenome]